MEKKRFFVVFDVEYNKTEISEDEVFECLPDYLAIVIENDTEGPYVVKNPIVYRNFTDLQYDVSNKRRCFNK